MTLAEILRAYEIRRLVDYSPNEPRVPKGQAGAGQWTSGAGSLGALAQQFAALGMLKEFPPAKSSRYGEQSRKQVESAVAKGRKRVDEFVKSATYAKRDVEATQKALGRIIYEAAREIEGYVQCTLGSDGEALAEFGRIYRGECQKYFHTTIGMEIPVSKYVDRAKAQLTGMLYAADVLTSGRTLGDWARADYEKVNEKKNAWLYLSKEKTYNIDGKKFKCTVTVVKEDPYKSDASEENKRKRNVYNVKGIVSDAVPKFEVCSVRVEEV